MQLEELVEMESEDAEYLAEILPVDARLSFSASAHELAELFARAASVIPAREVIPGTAFALLEVEADSLRLTASDGDQTVSVTLSGIRTYMAGVALVPAKRLFDILKLAPVSTTKMEIIGDSMSVRSGRALWHVKVPVSGAINARLDVSGLQIHTVPVAGLVRALGVARMAASTTNARVSLTQVQIRDGSITGCDGGRLHRVAVPGLDPTIDVTIPVKAVDEIVKALKAADDATVGLGFDDTHVVVKVGQDDIVAQRLLVPFPDVEPLILGPSYGNDHTLVAMNLELSAAIKRARVNSDPDSAIITLSVVPGTETNSWVLVVQTKDRIGNMSKEAMVCRWSGEVSHTVYVNHRYLSDLLEALDDEYVGIKLGADTKATKSPLLVESAEFTGIVQQMTVIW